MEGEEGFFFLFCLITAGNGMSVEYKFYKNSFLFLVYMMHDLFDNKILVAMSHVCLEAVLYILSSFLFLTSRHGDREQQQYPDG
jgi:hypothetical protein